MAEDAVDTEDAVALRCIICRGPDRDPRIMRIARLRRHPRITITTTTDSASPQES